jgi:hypothetical protein
MTEQSDGVTDARIQAAKVIAGILKSLQGARRGRIGSAAKSPDQREGVFDVQGRAGDGARAWAVPFPAGAMTERTAAWCRSKAKA